MTVRASTPQDAHIAKTALRVLVIDDDPEFRALLSHHITTHWPDAVIDELDPQVEQSSLFDLRANHYDVVFLDHHLGKFTGLQLLCEYKQDPTFPPVIFTTAFGDERLAATAIKNGADDYLPKTKLSNQLVVTTIRECLRAVQPVRLGRRAKKRFIHGGTVNGTIIKGFDVQKKIATGSHSVIYLARSHARNEDVALKVLYGSVELSEEHEVLERFLIEYQAISTIKHPNIVKIFDVGVADDHAFISMEFLSGGSLQHVLQEKGNLGVTEALSIAREIALALAAIHEVNILHRDLKPGNVMFRENGELCIIDFGLAKQVQIEQEITQPGKIYGTPYYMSPEQGQGDEIDARSDFYGLGVMLFEMLTGKKPYIAGTPVALLYKHVHAPIPKLPNELQDYQLLIDTLLAKDPENRPQDLNKLTRLLN